MKRLRSGTLGVAAALLLLVALVSLARQAWIPQSAFSVPVAESRCLNINQATVLELTVLPGIGPVLAKRIVSLREARGGFQRVDELIQVRGLGNKKLGRIRPQLTLRGKTPD